MSNLSSPLYDGSEIEALPGSMLEYQQRLLRMSSSQGISNIQEAFVAVRLGNQNWLVELSEVQEALAPPRMARIGSSPSWIAGVVGVRGQVWSVIDMLALSPGQSNQFSALGKARGWMTLLREKDSTDLQGDRLALLWSDMVEVATKHDYHKVSTLEDLVSPQSDSSPTPVNPVLADIETGQVQGGAASGQDRLRQEFLSLVGEDGALPPWTRALWQDRSGKLWRELDTSQILGPQGLVASWRQRVDIPAPDQK